MKNETLSSLLLCAAAAVLAHPQAPAVAAKTDDVFRCTFGSVSAPGGSAVYVPVALSRGETEPSTVIVHLDFAGFSVIPVAVLRGAAAEAGGKSVAYNVHGEQLSIVIYGGDTILEDGAVFAVAFRTDSAALPGQVLALPTGEAHGASPDAEPIHGEIVAGNIEVLASSGYHAADSGANWGISLSELMRVIQFYNSGEFHCQAGTEDGYAPLPGGHSCPPHSADYNAQDWQISLSELLRVIQFYNSPDGSYHPDPSGEDAFAPGPFPAPTG